jgi:hypothetical protein
MSKTEKVKIVGGCSKHVIVERPIAGTDDVEQLMMGRCPEGKPIPTEDGVYHLQRAADGSGHEMQTLVEPRKGPSRVATRAYRSHYDAIFGAGKSGSKSTAN